MTQHHNTIVSMGPGMCGRCYDEVPDVYPANCAEKPELLINAPIGMYHCPDCGGMLLAGTEHPPLCGICVQRKHPGFDRPEDSREQP